MVRQDAVEERSRADSRDDTRDQKDGAEETGLAARVAVWFLVARPLSIKKHMKRMG